MTRLRCWKFIDSCGCEIILFLSILNCSLSLLLFKFGRKYFLLAISYNVCCSVDVPTSIEIYCGGMYTNSCYMTEHSLRGLCLLSVREDLVYSFIVYLRVVLRKTFCERKRALEETFVQYYFIKSNQITAIILPMIFLGMSSRSRKNIAAATKTITILNVVIAETRLRFQTAKINITHDSDCKNLKLPVIAMSFGEYMLLLCETIVAIHRKINWLRREIMVHAVNPVIFCKALSAVSDTPSNTPLSIIIKKYLSNLNFPMRCFLDTITIHTRSKHVQNICISVSDSCRNIVAKNIVIGV